MIAITISPLDGESLPTITMLPNIISDLELDYEQLSFWGLAGMILSRYREQVLMKRKIELNKLKSKRGK